jgi:hypothetical protein
MNYTTTSSFLQPISDYLYFEYLQEGSVRWREAGEEPGKVPCARISVR